MLTIAISKEATGCYLWALHNGADLFVEPGDPEVSISDCLSSAAGYLIDEPLVAISYRGVISGTVVAERLSHEASVVADWVVTCFGEVAYALK